MYITKDNKGSQNNYKTTLINFKDLNLNHRKLLYNKIVKTT